MFYNKTDNKMYYNSVIYKHPPQTTGKNVSKLTVVLLLVSSPREHSREIKVVIPFSQCFTWKKISCYTLLRLEKKCSPSIFSISRITGWEEFCHPQLFFPSQQTSV